LIGGSSNYPPLFLAAAKICPAIEPFEFGIIIPEAGGFFAEKIAEFETYESSCLCNDLYGAKLNEKRH